MRKTLTLLALLLAFCSLQVSAQDRTISGKVSSSQDNQTIPGVSVVVVGTTIGTSTDIDGNYKLNVPKTAKTLRYSGIGMRTKEVALGASNVLDVVLDADVMKLDEVVVTALGIKQEKKAVGYSVQDVGGDALTKAGSRDVINGMSAKVSGMTVINSTGTPGGSSFIRLRGWNSIWVPILPSSSLTVFPWTTRTTCPVTPTMVRTTVWRASLTPTVPSTSTRMTLNRSLY